MKYSYYFWILCIVGIILFGCGKKYEQVEIDVAEAVIEEVEEAAPTGEYYFLAFKESFPKNIQDMKQAKLFVCGNMGNDEILKVLTASLNENKFLLFKSFHKFFINQNLISGQMEMPQDFTIRFKDGRVLNISGISSVYCKDCTTDSLISKCLQEMQRTEETSVLLIEKDMDSEMLNQMVEIVFI